MRTPIGETGYILAVAEQLLDENFPGSPPNWFLERFVRRFLNQPGYSSGDGVVALFDAVLKLPDDHSDKREAATRMMDFVVSFVEGRDDIPLEDGPLMINIATTVAYALDAIKAHTAGKADIAWSLVADAQYFLGICNWTVRVRQPEPALPTGSDSVSLQQHLKAAAEASHATHYEAKAVVWEWCGQNYKSPMTITAAADQVFKANLVNLSWETIYSYVSQWRKLKITNS